MAGWVNGRNTLPLEVCFSTTLAALYSVRSQCPSIKVSREKHGFSHDLAIMERHNLRGRRKPSEHQVNRTDTQHQGTRRSATRTCARRASIIFCHAPLLEILVDRALRQQVVRQQVPLAASAVETIQCTCTF